MELYIYSGKCLIGRCGDETRLKDSFGENLFVGDIVVIYTETSAPTLTVISDHNLQSYSDNTYTEGPHDAFVMGISSVKNWDHGSQWQVSKVKSYADLVDGERWPSFGFNVGKLNQTLQKPAPDAGEKEE